MPAQAEKSKFHIPEKIGIPHLERKYALMYIISTLGLVTREQIVKLGGEIHKANADGRVLTVKELLNNVLGALPKNRDPFLENTVLEYSQEELEQHVDLSTPIMPSENPRGFVDTWAGKGAGRPLLLDISWLDSFGLVHLANREKQECFTPSRRGRLFSKAIKGVFDQHSWQPQERVVLKKY